MASSLNPCEGDFAVLRYSSMCTAILLPKVMSVSHKAESESFAPFFGAMTLESCGGQAGESIRNARPEVSIRAHGRMWVISRYP